ncbi:MAG TPA: DUF3486 family protein [Candidatus Ozemobacteraceae bacterium]|nr:DUF3486 family protein [Candidatus Ozemobacteraceae bacterium]
MPRKSSVSALPPAVKEWLDKALVENNFSGYETLSDALAEKGFSISKSAVHRYGSEFEKTMAAAKIATEQAKALVDACPDDAGKMNDALIRLVQQKAFEVLLEADSDKKNLCSLGKMVGSLSRSSVGVKKWMLEVRDKARAAAEEVTKIVKQGGLTDETVQQIRAKILGVAG